MFPRYLVIDKGEKNQDIEKFLWRFNDNENKGHLYAGSFVGRKEGRKELWSWEGILAAKCLTKMCVTTVSALLVSEWDMVAIGVKELAEIIKGN